VGERGVVVGEWEWTVERRREREGGWQLAVSGGHMARVNAEVGRGGHGEQEERGAVPGGTAAWRLRACVACLLLGELGRRRNGSARGALLCFGEGSWAGSALFQL
jgi:hypothetical protein